MINQSRSREMMLVMECLSIERAQSHRIFLR
jgi:hypothetical protein